MRKERTMKIPESIKTKLYEFSKSDIKIKIAVAAGLIGILIIFLSTLGSEEKDTKSDSENLKNDVVSEDTTAYKNQLEKELTSLLESITGVGEAKVMISIEGTTEYVYAEELSSDIDSSEEKTSESHENKIVIIENNGKTEALVKKVIRPQVSGVAVVCQGGDNISVKENIISAVSTVLSIPSNKICVEALSR